MNVSKKQLAALRSSIGFVIDLKANKVLGVGRTPVILRSVNAKDGTAVVSAQWDESKPWTPFKVANTRRQTVMLEDFAKLSEPIAK